MKIAIEESTPLKWPDGWGRTLIEHRRSQTSWKRPFFFYRDAAAKELERMGVVSATISRNSGTIERQDPGVALWFSLNGQNAPINDNCIPMDRFTDARQNLAAICSALRRFRRLERLGMLAILERVMTTAFKTALPANVEARKEAVAL